LGIEGNHDEMSECCGSGVRPLELTIPTILPRPLPALAFCVVRLDDPKFCHAATGVNAMPFVFPIPGRAAFLRSVKINLASHSSWWANAVHDCSLHSLV
jgi:hypothetical protein